MKQDVGTIVPEEALSGFSSAVSPVVVYKDTRYSGKLLIGTVRSLCPLLVTVLLMGEQLGLLLLIMQHSPLLI